MLLLRGLVLFVILVFLCHLLPRSIVLLVLVELIRVQTQVKLQAVRDYVMR